MTWQWTVFTVPLVVAFCLLCVVAAFLFARWRRNDSVPGIALATGLVISIAVTLGWYVLELSAVSLETKLLFNQLQYIGLAPVTPFILGYVLVYIGRGDLLTRRGYLLLFAPAVLTLFAVFTNDFHWLFWADVSLHHGESSVMLTNYFGPAYAGFFAYTCAYAITSMALLGWKAIDAHGVHRWQIGALIVGIVAPLFGGTVYVLGFVPPQYPTPTYVGFVVTAVAFAWPVFRLDLFGLVPIAYRTLVEQMDDGVVACDENGTIVTANDGAATLLESTPAALVGELVEDELALIVADENGAPPHLADGPGEWTTTVGNRVVDVSVTRLEQSDTRVGRLYLLTDVTERHNRERRLNRQNTYLDEFASVVSHDIATPLTIIENQAQLVEMTGDTDHVDEIFESTERIHELMDELLELARQGKAVDETEPVDLATITRTVWRDIDRQESGLIVESSKGFLASETRLVQLLENLLQNAVTHGSPARRSETDAGSHRGGGGAGARERDLTIRVGALSDGFYLEDDGVGIPPDDRAQVFEQGYTSTPDGTGLGLAIVERIATAHGWTITATESDEGGARFEVVGVDAVPADSLEDDTDRLRTGDRSVGATNGRVPER
ncbi:hypothetical protein HALLA_00410 (plasmid) [Halostagnicola larsenii XH-48]|uniref:histidine kinase n=1 Tax=Halostagnicola larsenii XH-48 TaxID=797299 RepID=W0JX54_9EURY|nr:histidine kinase N-terminal 7TM domain-containing protein [Halostagnicola larsenii]AHG01785.1 hypothetical protein HALLA_00410 [Halostagnicola larsenii XH-48]